MHLFVDFAWKEKWSLHGLWPKCLIVRDSEGTWKIIDKEIWGRCMWINISQWVKMQKFVSHVNVFLKVTSEKNNFNSKDRMTHFLDTSQLLSPATLSSLLLLAGFMNRVAMVSGIEVMP